MFPKKENYVEYLDSFKNIGIRPYEEKEVLIRKDIGDKVSIFLLRDILFSMLSLSPKRYIPYVYSWGKFVGYQTATQALRTLGLGLATKLFVRLYHTKILNIEFYKDAFIKGWTYMGYGIPSFVYIDEKTGTFRIKNEECTESYKLPYVGKRVCFFERGLISGLFENIFERTVNSLETKCNAYGDAYCETLVELNSEFPKFEIYDKKIFDKIKRYNLNIILLEKPLRKELKDYTSLSIFQVAYLGMWLSSTGSHTLLYWVGKNSGMEIGKKIKRNTKHFVKFAKSLKLGEIDVKKNNDKFVFSVHECAFCSGAKNIDKRICSYLAGLIAGFLESSYKNRFTVVETKCVANGDKNCEFMTV